MPQNYISQINGAEISASFAVSSSYAFSSSYYQETDPIFTAKSASLATTGSNNFNGNQTITGSLIVNDGTYEIVDTTNKVLRDNNGGEAIDWTSRRIKDASGLTAIDWEGRALADSISNPSIDWENRILYASDGTTPSLNWSSNLVTTSPTFFTTTISTGSQEDFSSTSNYAGTVIEGQIDVNVVLYDLVCLRTDKQWYQNFQSGVDRSTLKLGIYLGNNLVLTEGHIVLHQDGIVGPSIQLPQLGIPVFIREGAGTNMSCTPPNTGYVRILGHIYYQNINTSTKLFIMRFNPSNDYYLLG